MTKKKLDRLSEKISAVATSPHIPPVERGMLAAILLDLIKLYPPDEPPDDVRALFNKGIGVQKDNRFSFSFETKEEAERAFHYIADLGTLETSQPPKHPNRPAEPK